MLASNGGHVYYVIVAMIIECKLQPSLPPHPLQNNYGSDSSAADYLSHGFFFQNRQVRKQSSIHWLVVFPQ
jgi:hypothetical protein